MSKHIADIKAKYLIPGETQEMALMFVPSESVYAEMHESFDDIVQKAFRAKVVIVSPSLLMIAVHVIQQNPARRAHARGRRPDSDRGRQTDRRRYAHARARAQAAAAFRPDQRGRPADPDLGREGGKARRPHHRRRVRGRKGHRPKSFPHRWYGSSKPANNALRWQAGPNRLRRVHERSRRRRGIEAPVAARSACGLSSNGAC